MVTCLLCPRLIRNVRSRRHIDSPFIFAHPVNFDIQRERTLKCDGNNSTHISIYYPLDNRYGFSISVQLEITPLSVVSFFSTSKNRFQNFHESKAAECCSVFQRRSCVFFLHDAISLDLCKLQRCGLLVHSSLHHQLGKIYMLNHFSKI